MKSAISAAAFSALLISACEPAPPQAAQTKAAAETSPLDHEVPMESENEESIVAREARETADTAAVMAAEAAAAAAARPGRFSKPQFNQYVLGLTKAELRQRLGSPDTVHSDGSWTYFNLPVFDDEAGIKTRWVRVQFMGAGGMDDQVRAVSY